MTTTTELRETIDAWGRYIDRLSQSHDSRDLQLVTRALLRRGTTSAILKEWDAALADFQRVIGQQQAEAAEMQAAHMMAGAVYTELRQDEKAIECYTTVLDEFERASRKEKKRYAEQIPILYLYRGMLSGRLGRYQQAIADCDRAAHFFPDHAEIFSVRGISYAYLGELDRALSDGRRAIALAPQEVNHYNRLGEIYLLRQEYAQALDTFGRGKELDPTDERIQTNWSRALLSWMLVLFRCQDENEVPTNTDQEP